MFSKRKKDIRTYRNFKHWTTSKLQEIIDEPYNRGIDGHDYQPYIEEIKNVYYTRISSNLEKNIENIIQWRYENER